MFVKIFGHFLNFSVLFEPDPEFGPCQFVLNRSQFRKFCTKLVDKVNKLIVDALRFCSKNNLIINHVMLAGASSKLFIVSLRQLFWLMDVYFRA